MCRRSSISGYNVAREEILKYKLEKLEEQRDLYWCQRAQAHWLRNGDRNTKFFHAFASERRRRNIIKKIIKEDGSVVMMEGELKETITNFYKLLFHSNAGTRYDEIMNEVQPRVTDVMNQFLVRDVFDEEIKAALDSMGDVKRQGRMVCLLYSINIFGILWVVMSPGRSKISYMVVICRPGGMKQWWF